MYLILLFQKSLYRHPSKINEVNDSRPQHSVHIGISELFLERDFATFLHHFDQSRKKTSRARPPCRFFRIGGAFCTERRARNDKVNVTSFVNTSNSVLRRS